MFRGGFGGFGGMGGMGGMQDEEDKPAKEVDNTTLYTVLDVPKTATTQQIKKAFRKKALKEHPDKGGDPEKFKKISQAYQILQNPEKRSLYDQYGMEGVQSGGAPGGGGFEDLFSFFGGGGRKKDSGPKKAKAKLVSLEVTLEQVYSGCMKNVNVKRLRVCQKCEGKGGKDVKICTKCKGRKVIEKLVQLGPGMYTQSQQHCPQCKATGQIMNEKDRCKECMGKKVLEKEKVVEVSIESGCPHQHDYVITGESDEYPGVMAGDLYIRTSIKKHKTYQRRGADLAFKKKITLLQALTGVTMELTHLDGKKFTVATAPGEVIKNKQIKTVKGLGMPFYKDAMSHGNLYIEFDVEYPKKNSITAEKAKIIREILGGNEINQQQPTEVQPPQNKKKGSKTDIKKEKENLFLEDFHEHDLNKDPRGGSGKNKHYNQQQEEERGGGQRAQCQQQ